MKIAIDCRFWGPHHTGLGRYAQSLVTAMHHLKPKHEIFLLINPLDKRKVKSVAPNFNLVPCTFKPYSLREQLEIPRVLDDLQPDLVHFLHFNVSLFYSQPFMVTIHDLIKHHSTGKQTTTKSPLSYYFRRFGYHRVIRHAITQSTHILTPSRWVKKDILKFYSVSKNKITITPEAPAKIYTTPAKKTKPRLKTPYLIFVGNAYLHKNLIRLIKVVQKLNQDKTAIKTAMKTDIKTGIKLVIVTGRGVFYQRLRQQIRKLKAQSVVKLKSFASDQELKSLFHHSLAFITPSLLEGFGLPGLEAMVCGTIVLSSDRASLPEVYAKNAIYFNPVNQQDMINKINRVLNLSPSARQKAISKGKQYAHQFSWDKTAQKTLNIYNTVLTQA